jgi:hypothetical protein
MVNLMTIMILSWVYEKVALALNHLEMHRTQTEYEDSLTFKFGGYFKYQNVILVSYKTNNECLFRAMVRI